MESQVIKPYRNDNRSLLLTQNPILTLCKSVYLAHPDHAWERGLCENTNGLNQHCLPKAKSFETITEQHIHMEVNLLDSRPRKMLGYKRPNNVFFQAIMKQAA